MGTLWIATTDDFLRILQGLLPRGLVWTRDPARRLTRLLAGLADEYVRVQNRAGSMMEEADPATTTAAGLLPEWERVTGLPEFGYIPPTGSGARSAGLPARIGSRCPLPPGWDLGRDRRGTRVTTAPAFR